MKVIKHLFFAIWLVTGAASVVPAHGMSALLSRARHITRGARVQIKAPTAARTIHTSIPTQQQQQSGSLRNAISGWFTYVYNYLDCDNTSHYVYNCGNTSHIVINGGTATVRVAEDSKVQKKEISKEQEIMNSIYAHKNDALDLCHRFFMNNDTEGIRPVFEKCVQTNYGCYALNDSVVSNNALYSKFFPLVEEYCEILMQTKYGLDLLIDTLKQIRGKSAEALRSRLFLKIKSDPQILAQRSHSRIITLFPESLEEINDIAYQAHIDSIVYCVWFMHTLVYNENPQELFSKIMQKPSGMYLLENILKGSSSFTINGDDIAKLLITLLEENPYYIQGKDALLGDILCFINCYASYVSAQDKSKLAIFLSNQDFIATSSADTLFWLFRLLRDQDHIKQCFKLISDKNITVNLISALFKIQRFSPDTIDSTMLYQLIKEYPESLLMHTSTVLGQQVNFLTTSVKHALFMDNTQAFIRWASSDFAKNMVKKVLAKEKELEDKNFVTFYHGRRWEYGLIGDIYGKLYESKSGEQLNDFIFTHIDEPVLSGKIDAQFLKTEQATRERLLKHGNTKDSYRDIEGRTDRQRVLFLNKYLFGNSTNLGSNSFHYIMNNNNCGSIAISIEEVFSMFGYSHVYKQYEQELQKLSDRYNTLSRMGQLLMIAIPKDKVADYVYLTTSGGPKVSMEINGKQEYDTNTIVQHLYDVPVDQCEFGLINTKDGGLNPKGDVKVFDFNTVDPQVWQAFKEDFNELFARIAQSANEYESKKKIGQQHVPAECERILNTVTADAAVQAAKE